MDTVLAEAWTTDRFLAWDDKQEGKHEFDGQRVIQMTGGALPINASSSIFVSR